MSEDKKKTSFDTRRTVLAGLALFITFSDLNNKVEMGKEMGNEHRQVFIKHLRHHRP